MLRTIFCIKIKTNNVHSSYQYILEIILQKFWILGNINIIPHSVTTDYSADSTLMLHWGGLLKVQRNKVTTGSIGVARL